LQNDPTFFPLENTFFHAVPLHPNNAKNNPVNDGAFLLENVYSR